MKIKFNLLILLCFIANLTIAQQYFGMKIGANSATFSINEEDPDTELNSFLGVSATVYLQIPLSKNFSIQPQLNYLQKGAELQSDFDDGITFIFSYIDLGLMGKYSFNGEDIKPYAFLGPVIGYALSAKGKDNFSGETIKLDFEDDLDFTRLEYGLNIGGGVAFPIEFGEITVDIRYLLGASNLNSEEDPIVKNRGLGIHAGIRFPVGDNDLDE